MNPAVIPDVIKKLSKYWIYFLVVFLLIILISTFTHYGITWDEHVQDKYGNYTLDYFLSGFKDKSALTYKNLKFYGPGFEFMASLFTRLFPEHPFELRHFLIGITGLLTVVGTWFYSRKKEVLILPIFATLVLLLLPRFYGHMFNNSKDIPFACAFTWSMFTIINFQSKEKLMWLDAIFCGLAIGAALSIRVGGMLLYLFLATAVILRLTVIHLKSEDNNKPLELKGILRLGGMIGVVFLISWFIMIMVWPAAHQSPLLHPFESFNISKRFPQVYPVRFEGKLIINSDLPFYYLHKFIFMTTPVLILFLIPLGIFSLLKDSSFKKGLIKVIPSALLLLWLCFPVIYVTVFNPPLYDGIRHFLFIFPAIAITAATGINTILRYPKNIRQYSYVFLILFLLVMVPIKDYITLHPYQMTYFNELAGGVEGCYRKYETDYWTASYKEAVEWINEQANQYPDREVPVIVAASSNNFLCAKYYAGSRVKLYRVWTGKEKLPSDFVFFIGTTRDNMHLAFSHLPIVHKVGRENAYFTFIRANIPRKLEE